MDRHGHTSSLERIAAFINQRNIIMNGDALPSAPQKVVIKGSGELASHLRLTRMEVDDVLHALETVQSIVRRDENTIEILDSRSLGVIARRADWQ